jgi:hypothetical protein
MQQRHKTDVNVKVCPYVPRRVRDTAEKKAGKVRKSGKNAFAVSFIATWTTAGHDIATAETDAEALAIVEQLRGNPIVMPAVDGAT